MGVRHTGFPLNHLLIGGSASAPKARACPRVIQTFKFCDMFVHVGYLFPARVEVRAASQRIQRAYTYLSENLGRTSSGLWLSCDVLDQQRRDCSGVSQRVSLPPLFLRLQRQRKLPQGRVKRQIVERIVGGRVAGHKGAFAAGRRNTRLNVCSEIGSGNAVAPDARRSPLTTSSNHRLFLQNWPARTPLRVGLF